MPDQQPQLPFGDENTLEQIRQLLVTQNELLRTLVDRLSENPIGTDWSTAEIPAAYDVFVPEDPELESEFLDEDFWDDEFDEEALPEPPDWFARHFFEG